MQLWSFIVTESRLQLSPIQQLPLGDLFIIRGLLQCQDCFHYFTCVVAPRDIALPIKMMTSFALATNAYLRLIRLDQPTGTWLLVLPSMWGVALAAQAGSLPDWKMMSIMLAVAFITRSAGNIINDFLDQDLDRQVGELVSLGIATFSDVIGRTYQDEANC